MDPQYLKQREVQEALLGLPDDTWLFELQRERQLDAACAGLVQLITDKRTGLSLERTAKALYALGLSLIETESPEKGREMPPVQAVQAFVDEVAQAITRLMSRCQ